ncbi:hypothetical protein HPP92_017461 [Vanilla planifolia]|uniref:Uncharacterized protein n=1 Tax=Vanilla planifolia TaxID=51239 RepID=A0A835QH43_VANPL|nr:hypothetical protein HPP92_017461 [Vanilla planifolia]
MFSGRFKNLTSYVSSTKERRTDKGKILAVDANLIFGTFATERKSRSQLIVDSRQSGRNRTPAVDVVQETPELSDGDRDAQQEPSANALAREKRKRRIREGDGGTGGRRD